MEIPVVIDHPLNRIAVSSHGGKVEPSVLHLPGSDDHASGYGNIYKLKPVIKQQVSRPVGIRGAFANLFTKKGNL